jgi:hypothetical protein
MAREWLSPNLVICVVQPVKILRGEAAKKVRKPKVAKK